MQGFKRNECYITSKTGRNLSRFPSPQAKKMLQANKKALIIRTIVIEYTCVSYKY